MTGDWALQATGRHRLLQTLTQKPTAYSVAAGSLRFYLLGLRVVLDGGGLLQDMEFADLPGREGPAPGPCHPGSALEERGWRGWRGPRETGRFLS